MIDFKKLTKEIEKEKQENYRRYGVRDLGFRVLIISWVMSFADEEYQKLDWCSKGSRSYAYMTESAYNFIIEDTGMENYLENKQIPYDEIGGMLKTSEEAEELYKFCRIFYDFLEDVPQRSPNEDYLNSKYYKDMVKAAQSVMEIFFQNEEDKPEAYSKM